MWRMDEIDHKEFLRIINGISESIDVIYGLGLYHADKKVYDKLTPEVMKIQQYTDELLKKSIVTVSARRC